MAKDGPINNNESIALFRALLKAIIGSCNGIRAMIHSADFGKDRAGSNVHSETTYFPSQSAYVPQFCHQPMPFKSTLHGYSAVKDNSFWRSHCRKGILPGAIEPILAHFCQFFNQVCVIWVPLSQLPTFFFAVARIDHVMFFFNFLRQSSITVYDIALYAIPRQLVNQNRDAWDGWRSKAAQMCSFYSCTR